MTTVTVTDGRWPRNGVLTVSRTALIRSRISHRNDAMHPRAPLSLLFVLLLACATTACRQAPAGDAMLPAAAQAATVAVADAMLAHGEYIVRIGGCNDCHTAGYGERGGQVPTSEWLTGSPTGYHGPWGTTYATNLRLTVAGMDEAQWLAYTGNLHTRPIMPDFMLRGMREHDRRAIYRFVRSLGAAGRPAPAALPPGQAPPPPYFQLVLPTPGAPHPERRRDHQGHHPVQ